MQVTMAGKRVEVDATGHEAWWSRFVDGTWEPETLRALHTTVEPGSTFLDIGAWQGPVSLYAAALGANVHAYEPDPKARAVFERNLERNPELAARITLHPYALGRTAGTLRLSSTTLGNSASTLRKMVDGESVEVEVRRFEDEATSEHFRDARVMKVDIEGSEYLLLPEISKLLRRTGAVLLLSTHVSHIHPMLPPRWPRLARAAVQRVLAMRCYAEVMWHLRHVRHWYVADGPRWRPVGRMGYARFTMRPIRPQSGELIVSPRALAL